MVDPGELPSGDCTLRHEQTLRPAQIDLPKIAALIWTFDCILGLGVGPIFLFAVFTHYDCRIHTAIAMVLFARFGLEQTLNTMRKFIVLSMITFDGVMQAPGGPKEDTSGGFKYGGWVAPFSDEDYDKVVIKELEEPADYLLGRKTFDIWEKYWPRHADTWPGINEGAKYVLSKTRKKSDWKNTVFVKSLAEIKKLKKSDGADIQVWGSSKLIQLLLKHDLVDELRLKIHPITLGKGKKLFDKGTIPAAFELTGSSVTTAGVIIAYYKRAGKVKTGNAAE